MIYNASFSLFPGDELFTFAKGTLAIVEPKKDQVPSLVPFIEKVSQQTGIYQSAMERERKNPFTALLAQQDAVRDAAFFAFRMYVEAAAYRQKDGWNAASVKIQEVIRRYGWSAPTLGYKAETAVLTNIISDLHNRYSAELNLLEATAWLTELETAQQAFESVSNQSVTTPQASGPVILNARPQLVTALKSLLSMVSLLNNGSPSDILAAMEMALNELFARSLSTVKAADTRAENAKKTEGTTPAS